MRGAEGVSSPCSLTLKKNKKVCVAPEVPWIQLLIHKLTQRYATPSDRKTSNVPSVLAGRSPPPDCFVFVSFLPQKSAGMPPKKQRRRGRGGKRSGGLGERSGGAGPLADPPPHLSLCPDTIINNQPWLFIPLRGQQ